MEHNQNFFTAGELAKLTGISRQLLIYYDKNHIFSPSFTGENGYRYYSLHQYFILEILITLRKMGLSLQEIKHYIDERNIDNLSELYQEKLTTYSQLINNLQRKSLFLRNRISNLRTLKNIRLNEILLYEVTEETFFQTVDVSMAWPVKKRVNQIAKTMLPCLTDPNSLDNCLEGVLLPKKSINRNTNYKLDKYSLLISQNSQNIVNYTTNNNFIIFPKGLYITINIVNHFGVMNFKQKDKILTFIENNNLKIISDIACFPLTNHWMVMPEQKELSKILINVEYKE